MTHLNPVKTLKGFQWKLNLALVRCSNIIKPAEKCGEEELELLPEDSLWLSASLRKLSNIGKSRWWCNKGVHLGSCFPLKCQWELHNSFAHSYRNILHFLLYFQRLSTGFTAALSRAVLALLNCGCKGLPPLHRRAEDKVFTVWFVRCLHFLNQTHTLEQPVQGGTGRCSSGSQLSSAQCCAVTKPALKFMASFDTC